MSFIYHRGKFIRTDTIPSVQGVFSTLLMEDGKLYFFKEHVQRIKKHCNDLGIDFPGCGINILRDLVLLNQSGKGRFRLRMIVSKEGLTLTLNKEPPCKREIHLCLYPESLVPSNTKTWPYTDRKNLLFYAQSQKADDCLTFDYFGNILEASVANVFWIRDDTFFYPDSSLGYFEGITLKQAIFLSREHQLSIKKGKFSKQDLDDSTVFYCNSIKGILPVKNIEHRALNFDQLLIDLYSRAYLNLADTSAVGLHG